MAIWTSADPVSFSLRRLSAMTCTFAVDASLCLLCCSARVPLASRTPARSQSEVYRIRLTVKPGRSALAEDQVRAVIRLIGPPQQVEQAGEHGHQDGRILF